MASNWISYNELAWTEDYLGNPLDYEKELNSYIKSINQTAKFPIKTMLHLGCGAGGHDTFFKKYYKVTGVDLSLGMLDLAKIKNPDIEYIEGDMRNVRLGQTFDCVVIPDSIDYINTIDDLKKTIETCAIHLNPNGVLMIIAKTKETFQNNNFSYSCERDDTYITVFENNYINPYNPNTYEITLIYLIRQKGKLSKFIEESTAGLFPKNIWDDIFLEHNFLMKTEKLDGIYDNFLLENGSYPLTIFIGNKK